MKFGIKGKNNKQNKTIIALIIGIVAVSIFIAVMIGSNLNTDEPEVSTEPTTEVSETVVDIVIDEDITETSADESTTVKEAEIIKLEEPEITTTKKPSTSTSNKNTNTVKPAEPVTQAPSPGTQGPHFEIIDDGNDSVNEYSCGSAKHHCDSKETHNFIVSLEKKGCPYCGSHSCKSFYTVDEWGNACYDASKCESYSAKNDPCEYCQECGKKCGIGDNGTCVRFTVDTVCPECGKSVKAKTCHSH